MPPDQTDLPPAWDVLLDLRGDGPVHVRLEVALRRAVRDGRAAPGAALPPSRVLAATLGVSRWVVTQAYGHLVAEGVLEARTGSATRVASRPADLRGTVVGTRQTPVPARRAFDLAPGVPDLRHVPRADWVRATRTALSDASDADLAGPVPGGHPRARAALLAHLLASRAVVADDVRVTSGAAEGMRRVASALLAAGHRSVLVEDPGWPRLREVAASAGLAPVPVPVDADGLDVAQARRSAARTGARAVLVTPAHHFPTGAALAPERRDALVRWAREVDGLVVEDDYDAEHRYDRRPVAALQGLAPERVLLLGSLSKTWSPAVGLGWAVVPPRWRDAFDAADGADPSTLTQLVVAELLAGGAYARHVRAGRVRYARRRRALVDALHRHLPGCAVDGLDAGLHVRLHLPDGVDGDVVAAAAARLDVTVAPGSRYDAAGGSASRGTLVLGYGALADARVEGAVARLAAAVREVASGRS